MPAASSGSSITLKTEGSRRRMTAQEIAEHDGDLVNIGSLFGSYFELSRSFRPFRSSGAPHAMRQFVQRNDSSCQCDNVGSPARVLR